jgi:hypothetical protein
VSGSVAVIVVVVYTGGWKKGPKSCIVRVETDRYSYGTCDAI